MNERIENTYTQCGNVKSKRIENTYTQCGSLSFIVAQSDLQSDCIEYKHL